MSEVDDLTVVIMMRARDEAENATVQLIRLAEAGRLNAREKKLVMKAAERRIAKEKSGTDLADFLMRLANLVEPDVTLSSAESPADMDSPSDVLARRMRGEAASGNYEAEKPDPKPPPAEYYHPDDDKTRR